MQMNEYQLLARRTQNPKLGLKERKEHALMGMISELGEICGCYQKTHQGHPLIVNDVIDELGDLLWFIAEYCDTLRVDLKHVAERNIDKLKGRYPVGFAEERSLHRDAPVTTHEYNGEYGPLRITCYGDRDECAYFFDGSCALYDRPCAEIHIDMLKGDGEE